MSDVIKKKKKKKRRRIILLVLLVLLAGGWFFGDRFAKQKGYPGLWSLITTSTSNYSESINPDIVIAINIKDDDFAKLEKVREDALARGVIIQPEDPYVPCKVLYEDQEIKAQIRLKGKMTDHVEGEKWSFRVKTKKGDALMGMKRFTLQHPGTRSYLHEWIYHEMMAREDIIRLRYKFIQVILNGNDLGVYALEEHFGQELLGNNGRNKGPIFRFNPSLYWYYRLNELNKIEIVEEYTRFQNAQIEPFTTGDVMKDSVLRENFRNGMLAMEAFRRGEVPAKDVLDVEKFARRHAILDLIGGYHSVDWSDVKFYFNPETMLIEPVAYESFSAREVKELIGHFRYTGHEGYSDDFHEVLFNDPDFFRAYMQNLDRMSKQEYLDNFFAETDSALNHNLAILYSEFPFKDFTKEVYFYNQDIIRRSLDSPQAFHAHLDGISDSTMTLQVGSIESLPAEIKAISVNGERTEVDGHVVPAKALDEYVTYKTYTFPNLLDSLTVEDDPEIIIHYTMLGLNQELEVEVMNSAFQDVADIDGHYLSREPTFRNFDFLEVNEASREIICKTGTWEINSDLVIPAGWNFRAVGGITLSMSNGSKIISRSPMELKGTEEAPVDVKGVEGGQGIIVLNTSETSVFDYVDFEGLTNPSDKNFSHNSSITLYEADAEFNNCTFFENKGQKVVEATRCEIRIRSSVFSGVAEDAIRLNFCASRMNKVRFHHVQDQAVIVTGGELRFNTLEITHVKDEALLIKEQAVCNGQSLIVTSCGTALEARDAAHVELSTIEVNSVKNGFKAHQKGDVFGPAVIKLNGLLGTSENMFKIEDPSEIWVDGTKKENNETAN